MLKRHLMMEYYFDSNKYNEVDVLENMEKKKLEFPRKKMDMTISLNKYGTYVVKLQFMYNEIALIKHKKVNKKINTKTQKFMDNIEKQKNIYQFNNIVLLI